MPAAGISQVAEKNAILLSSHQADSTERRLFGNFFRAVSAASMVNRFLLMLQSVRIGLRRPTCMMK